MINLVGLVIVYNPQNNEVVENIYSYLDELDKLYVFDNSDNSLCNPEVYNSISDKIVYKSFHENKGIAFALNYFCNIAITEGYSYILTMDQDSSFNKGDLKLYLVNVDSEAQLTAIYAPLYVGEKVGKNQFFTSGSILNLKIWKEIEGFDENLFIDEVDGDFTFRVINSGFKLKKVNSIILNHLLGAKKSKILFGKQFFSDNHTPIRKYYIARNRVYIIKNRRSVLFIYLKDSVIKLINMIVVEDNLLVKFSYIFKGIIDGLFNNMGKIKL
jgi:rhamnosyltransferase